MMKGIACAVLFAILAIAHCNKPPASVAEKIELIFFNMDMDHNDTITLEEVSTYFTQYSGGTGIVDFHNFHHLWNSKYHDTERTMHYLFNEFDKATMDGLLDANDLNAMFTEIDTNDDGLVNREEFKAYFNQLYAGAPDPMP